MASFVKIHAMGDDPCETCADLDNEVVTRQYWRAHTHPNCKCVAVPVTKADMTKKERAVAAKLKKAKNMESDETAEGVEAAETPETAAPKTVDENGEVDVQVAVTGEITGSDKEGRPIEQHITEEALSDIAEALNADKKEVLVDKDHQSAREGLDRDTHAMGWLSKFWANAKGLFAKLKLTPTGKALVEGREYRKLSPVFTLDSDGKPTSLVSAAFTNTPAMQAIEPILNQKPNEELKMEITKEELIDLIKETVASMNEQPVEETEKPVEETEQPVEETASNECGETEKPEEKPAVDETPGKPAEEPKAEEPVEEKTEEKTEEEIVEVIKESALNAAPARAALDTGAEWRNLRGEDFFEWARSHRM